MNEQRLDYMPEIKFKKTNELAKLPTKNNSSDAGWDVYATEGILIPAKGSAVVPVGLTVAYISPGYYISVNPRSGLGFKSGIQPHLGTIDSEYRGDLAVKLYNFSDKDYQVSIGDRISQLIIHYNIDIEVKWGEIEQTKRNNQGFGSSGK